MAINFWAVHKGINFRPQSSAPASPAEGDVYFDSTLVKLRVYQNGAWVNITDSDGTVLLADGLAATPSLAFTNSTGTGLFLVAASRMGLTAGGTQYAEVNSAGFQVTNGILRVPLGSAGAPAYTFTGDLDTGIYSTGANIVAIAAGGGKIIEFDSSQVTCARNFIVYPGVSGSTTQIQVQNAYDAANSAARLLLDVGGDSAHDPYITFRLIGGALTNWSLGVDNSDADTFKLGQSSSIGSNVYFGITTAGAVTIGTSGTSQGHTIYGKVGIGDIHSVNYILRAGNTEAANPLTGTTQVGMGSEMVATLNATTIVGVSANVTSSSLGTPTITYLAQFQANNRTKGAGSTINNKIGLLAFPQTGGAANAMLSDTQTLTAGSWALHLTSTNPSYFAGAIRHGTTSTLVYTNELLSVGYQNTVGTTDDAGAVLSQNLNLNTGASATFLRGLVGNLSRSMAAGSTPTESTNLYAVASRLSFNLGAGSTYINTGFVAGVVGPSLTQSGGTLALTNYCQFYAPASSAATGTNKFGLYIDSQSGATNNWQIYSAGSSPSHFSGPMDWDQIATPSNPAAGANRLYFKNVAGVDGLYMLTSAGVETKLTTGVGGGDILNGGNSFTAAMTIGTNDAYNLNLETNNTTRATFYSTGETYFPGKMQFGWPNNIASFNVECYTNPAANAISQSLYSRASNSFDGSVSSTSEALFVENVRTVNTAAAVDSQANLVLATRQQWIVGNGASLTHAGSVGTIADIRISPCTLTLTGTGTIALSHYAKISVLADSNATGANKYGIYLANISGATTANWQIYSAGSADSYFAGPIRIGNTSGISSGTEKLSVRKSVGATELSSAHCATVSEWLAANDLPLTSAGISGTAVYAQNTRIITASLTDTEAGFASVATETELNVASGQTYAATGSQGWSGIYIGAPSILSGGAASIQWHGLRIRESSVNTGTRKYAIWLGNYSGSTSENWQIYSAGTSPSYFAGPVQFADGAVATPSITFGADTDLGIYRAAANNLVFAANSAACLSITDARVLSYQQLQITGGTAGTPALCFATATSTGLFLNGSALGLTSGGTQYAEINSAGLQVTNGILRIPLGSVTAPSYTFTGDLNTGMWSPSADSIAFSTAGVNAGSISSAGLWTLGPSGAAVTHIINGRVKAYLADTNTAIGNALSQLVCVNADPTVNNYAGLSFSDNGSNFRAGIYAKFEDRTTNLASIRFANSIGAGTFTETGSISTTGAWTLGASGATITHAVNGSLFATVPGSAEIRITSTSSSSSAQFAAIVNAASTLDPFITFNDSANGGAWSAGRDTSDSNKFKISQANTLGSNDFLTITTAGAFTIGVSGGTANHVLYGTNLQIFSTSSSSVFTLYKGTQDGGIALNGDNVGTAGGQIVCYGSTNGSFASQVHFRSGSTVNGTISSAGLWTIGASSGTHTHAVNGSASITRQIMTQRFDVASAATITALDSTRSFVRLTGATATALQGITAGADGQVLRIFNSTGAALTVQHENAGASAANRITTMTGADVATTANGFAEFIYDTGSSRWICAYVSP